jgi:hypothetical protein
MKILSIKERDLENHIDSKKFVFEDFIFIYFWARRLLFGVIKV